jgi:hypothetical protein
MGGAAAPPVPQGQTMEIRVIKPFMFKGQRVEAGEVIDLPVADAAYVVGLGRAEEIQAPEEIQSPAAPKKAKAK